MDAAPEGPGRRPAVVAGRIAFLTVLRMNGLMAGMPSCLKCHGEKVVSGTITGSGRSLEFILFRPRNLRAFTFTLFGGTKLAREAFACRDCGLVWSSTDPAALQKFMRKHCAEPDA